jgi:hypothetical protein
MPDLAGASHKLSDYRGNNVPQGVWIDEQG